MAFFDVANGGTLDLSNGVCNGSSGLTFSDAFAVINRGGIVLASPSSFTGFSGVTGQRCIIDGDLTFNGTNPNKIFPGSADCVPTTEVGAIGVSSGAGGSSTYN